MSFTDKQPTPFKTLFKAASIVEGVLELSQESRITQLLSAPTNPIQ